MNQYESVVIVKPNLSKSALERITLMVENKIKEFGDITDKQDLGIRNLAYEVHKNNQAHYFVYQFEINKNIKQEATKEIERFYRITDEIIKYIIVKR